MISQFICGQIGQVQLHEKLWLQFISDIKFTVCSLIEIEDVKIFDSTNFHNYTVFISGTGTTSLSIILV